ncbi:MAG: hypothetical protein QXL94_06860 [Candidatus Parvarchaeum sp.]
MKKNKKSLKKKKPIKTSHKTTTKEYDLPVPIDVHFKALDVVLRLVPEIDNLFELALYIDPNTFARLEADLKQYGIKYDNVEAGYIARRGRKEKATNVFLIES